MPGSPSLWTRQGPGRSKLLDVAGLGHFADRDGLGSRESVVDRAAAGESTRELLADRGPDGLEFRDGDELDTDMRTGFTVGWAGSAELIDSRVSLPKGAAF
jgi:hypothetical protein